MTRSAWYRAQAEAFTALLGWPLRQGFVVPDNAYHYARMAFHFAICALDAESDEAFEAHCKAHPKEHWTGEIDDSHYASREA